MGYLQRALTTAVFAFAALRCTAAPSGPQKTGLVGSWALRSQVMVADSCCHTVDITSPYTRVHWTFRADSTWERTVASLSTAFVVVDSQTCDGTYQRVPTGFDVVPTSDFCGAEVVLQLEVYTTTMTVSGSYTAPYRFPDNVWRTARMVETYDRQ